MKPTSALILTACTIALCASCAATEGGATLAQLISEAMTDGAISPEEADQIKVAADAAAGAGSAWVGDWAGTIATGLGTILATFLGLRYAPNTLIVGKQEAAALDKIAKTG